MDMHRLETVLFSNGERFPILVNVKTGIPDFYSTLWVFGGVLKSVLIKISKQKAARTHHAVKQVIGFITPMTSLG